MSARHPEGVLFQVDAQFPVVYQPLFLPKRYKVFWGGRGKGTSWSFARALLVLAASKTLRILCTREFQNSIKDSVHRLLVDQIEALGLADYFHVTDTEIRCYATGSLFIFKGLYRNVNTIKSLEGIDIVWVEEAENVSEPSWRVLIPTIRKAGSEVWVSFNPNQPTDPTWKRFVANRPEDSIVVRTSWRDNPWFPEELRKEKDYDYRVDPDAAAHIWEGEFNFKNNAAVFNGKWIAQAFEPNSSWAGPYQGADWGFAQDPTVLTRSWIDNSETKRLYIEYEAWKIGCEIEDTPALFERVPMSRNYKIGADNARPETISHVAKKGFKIEGAEKWKGSVEDGVAFIRSFEQIVIHPRCTHTVQEARLYSHKLDKLTGEPLADIEDKHNHCWDSVRYGLGKLIRISKNAGRPSVRSL